MKLALSVLFHYELITSNLDIKVEIQKVSFSYKHSRYRAYFEANSLGRFSFNRWISARGFSGLGLGIDKRTFVSCCYIYLVSRKNKRFFQK